MPFKKAATKIFIGRTQETVFFKENILKPASPTHNIISISGESGVGKTELLEYFLDITHAPDYNSYCLAALVNETDATLDNMLEKFADQLHIKGNFKKALNNYRIILLNLQSDQEALREVSLTNAAELLGTVAEGTLPGGPFIKSGAKAGANVISSWMRPGQQLKAFERRMNATSDLTRAFVEELNGLTKRWRGVILMFDNFERLSPLVVPWLLDHFLEADVNSNVVLIVAGSDRIEQSIPGEFKNWLPYINTNTIYWMSLGSFTKEETIAFLAKRSIIDQDKVDKIWWLSQGLPLFVSMLSANLGEEVDPAVNVLNNFLQAIPEQEYDKRQLALSGAQFSRSFNRDDLEAFKLLPEDFAFLPKDKKVLTSLFQWLTEQPFVRSNPRDGRYRYQNLMRELFTRHLYQVSPKEYYATREGLANYYQQLLDKIQAERREEVYNATEWQELVQALVYQLFLLPDETSHIKAIELVLLAYHKTGQTEEIVGLLRELAQGQPENMASDSAREAAKQLIQYIEADLGSEEFLAAANFFLEKESHEPALSPDLLQRLYLKRGLTRLSLNQPGIAIEDLSHALELAPNNAWIYANRGFAHWNIGEYQQAIQDMGYALELAPNETIIYVFRGLAYLCIGDMEQAIPDLDHALKLEPDAAVAYAARGCAYSLANNPQQAIEDCTHALTLDPTLDLALALALKLVMDYVGRGYDYLQANNPQQAIEDCTHTLDLASKLQMGYILRDVAYFSRDAFHSATEDLNHKQEVASAQALAYSVRGYAYSLANNPQQAIEDCTHALTLASKLPQDPELSRDPELALAYAGRSLANLNIGEYQQAIEDLNHALDLDPEIPLAYAVRGLAYSLVNNPQQAIEDCTHALELDPEQALAYAVRGRAYLSLGEYQQAIEDYTHALELAPDSTLDPELAQAYAGRGFAFLEINDLEQAKSNLTLGWELDSTELNFGWMAAWFEMCQKRPDPGMAERLESIASVDPGNQIAHACQGVSLWLRKHFEEAIAELEQAIQLGPDEYDPYFWKGMACASLEERDEDAMTAIEKSLDLKMPPILLSPFRWFEQDMPEFYEMYAKPLLARYDLINSQ